MASAIDSLPTIRSCQAVSQIIRATARWGPHAGYGILTMVPIATVTLLPGFMGQQEPRFSTLRVGAPYKF